ncbi:hypothetical protein MNB_SV-3-171 [hydrothermal vent metagenome]|uniref:Prepilin-type N-terminal cleavage/methylation domain-containing protein n=1 Tax=hydrothermal vent metagenome TaxID=652676 RepID=A0A1W1BRR0_9ZZZZ
MKHYLRKGFTLIELLIVIFIISMVYFLGFHGIELDKKKPKVLTPLNLKENIVKNKWFNGHATLLCTDKCSSCYLRQDLSSPFHAYSNPINLKNLQVYTLDTDDNLIPVEYERFHNKKICLKMDFYDNGSSTQIILKQDKDIYFLPAFFGKAKHFDSLNAAKEYWLKNNDLITDRGNFY